MPLYTRIFAQGEYGIVTQLYAYVAFFNILFTYGLETGFFKYFNSEKNGDKVYSTSLISITVSSVLFALFIILFSGPISDFLLDDASDRLDYVSIFAIILACEAIAAIPFAKLRQQNRAKRFAFIRLVNIAVNIGLNLFFLLLCPWLIKNNLAGWLTKLYDPAIGVGYVFLANLIASVVTLLLLLPDMLVVRLKFDSLLWRQMIIYSFPLMIAGFAGMVNETFDRILIPILTPDKTSAMAQLGVYGACYKLSIIMTLFIQTFRYAAEPFFFNHSTKENATTVYANVMKAFVIVCAMIFLLVMLYLDLIKYFIGENFRSGLIIVPILLLANLCLGVYYNLSIWYKLTSKTRWGAYLSVFGAIVTLVFNVILIPIYGYLGAAWATLICYASMMVVSYLIGQRHYPVNYDLRSFFLYIVLALLLWQLSVFVDARIDLSEMKMLLLNTAIFLVFPVVIWFLERRKNNYLRSRI